MTFPAQISLEPPYYIVAFAASSDTLYQDYYKMAQKMVALAQAQEGYLGHDSVRTEEGISITNSYWRDEHAIQRWKSDTEHLLAQKLGREKWYKAYSVRVAKIERAYELYLNA